MKRHSLLDATLLTNYEVPQREIETEADALEYIDNFDEVAEREFTFQRRIIHRQENSMSSSDVSQTKEREMSDESGSKTMIKRKIKELNEGEVEKSKERKRNNRVNANRNDYGNEGFLMMILYYLGCCITLSKLQKDGNYQKLRIVEISYQDKLLLDRKDVEAEIDQMEFPASANLKRDKSIIASTTIDNTLLDILKDEFEISFIEGIKKKPEKKYMPSRRVLEFVEFDKQFGKKEIINEGVKFYDNLKEYGKKNKFIYLSKEYVEKCWREGIPVESPSEKNMMFVHGKPSILESQSLPMTISSPSMIEV